MIKYTGNISIYFPCQLEGNRQLKWFHDRWNRCRERQLYDIHLRKASRTDMMDLEVFRDEKEIVLQSLQYKIDVFGNANDKKSPYALECIKKAYQRNREDNLLSKNTNVVISRFTLIYDYPKSLICCSSLEAEGTLIYNVNADNNIATYIVLLHFEDMSVEEIILLKHIFYKRLRVKIQEYEINNNSACFTESLKGVFNCINGKKVGELKSYVSFQEFIAQKDICQRYAKRGDVDYRARYSLVELDNDFFSKQLYKDYYGIMCADEGYTYCSEGKLEKDFFHNLSMRESYAYYQCGLNGLLINKNRNVRSLCKTHQKLFEEKFNEDVSHIKTEHICNRCVAGIQEEFFPSFLKAVELHFLINNVRTNETEANDKSYMNPFIFIRRSIKLWNILYELDINSYHIHKKMFEAFGIQDNISQIKEEYKSLLQHAMSYVVVVFTLVQVIIAILK